MTGGQFLEVPFKIQMKDADVNGATESPGFLKLGNRYFQQADLEWPSRGLGRSSGKKDSTAVIGMVETVLLEKYAAIYSVPLK